jgi:hypothetical protein
MLRVSPAATGLDADIPAADLASLTGMSRDPELLDDLCAAVGVPPGFGASSPLTAEFVGGIVAAIVAAILAERSPLGGTPSPPLVRSSIYDAARVSLSKTPAPPADGQICVLFAVDIVGFTRPDRDDEIRFYLHDQLYKFLQKAFDDSGIPWADCFCEDRGDGALIVIPPGIAGKGIIDPLPERLRSLIRRHNHLSCVAAGIQLRAAAHIGPVDHDGHGFVGSDINLLFRMLEARPFKRAIATTGAELALIVSDYMYRSLVCRYPSLVSPDAFRAVRFQAKQTRARAWTYLPGTPS